MGRLPRKRKLQSHVSCPHVLSDFKTAEDAGNWDSALELLQPDLAARSMPLLGSNIVLATDFSGADFAADAFNNALRIISHAASQAKPRLTVARASDIGRMQQHVLTRRSQIEGGFQCVFSDIAEQLASEAGMQLEAMRPAKNSTKPVAARAYSEMADFLSSNRQWCLPQSKSSYCFCHKQQCPVQPGWVLSECQNGTSAEALKQQFSSPASSGSTPNAWWARFLDHPEESQASRPLSVNMSSLICVDYTPLGLQRGDAGPSQEQHAIWAAARRVNAERGHEDLYFTECAARYPVLKQHQKLGTTHKIVHIVLDASQEGFSIQRNRALAAGINRKTLVWCGPEDAEELESEFMMLYGRQGRLPGTIFSVATDEEIRDHHAALASTRLGRKVPPQSIVGQGLFSSGDFRKVLSVSNGLIRNECETMRQQLGKAGPYFADLEQHPDQGSCLPQDIIPALNTHPRIYFSGEDRMLLPSELYDAMGTDVRTGCFLGNRQLSPLANIIPELDVRDQLFLLGNGMHVPTMTSWFHYVLSRCVRVEHFYNIARPPSTLRPDEQDDDVFEDPMYELLLGIGGRKLYTTTQDPRGW